MKITASTMIELRNSNAYFCTLPDCTCLIFSDTNVVPFPSKLTEPSTIALSNQAADFPIMLKRIFLVINR